MMQETMKAGLHDQAAFAVQQMTRLHGAAA